MQRKEDQAIIAKEVSSLLKKENGLQKRKEGKEKRKLKLPVAPNG